MREIARLKSELADAAGVSMGTFRKWMKSENEELEKRGVKKHDKLLITAAVLSIGGLILLFCGIFIAPHGEIHESLLIGFGEVATFAGALFGIDYVYKKKN